MNTLLFLSQKGGSGKTTLAVHSAVAAVDDGLNVLVFDTDPQGSALGWGNQRGSEHAPEVVKASAQKVEATSAERRNGMLLIVDSAPHTAPDALRLAKAATLVVIPCRPTSFDLSAVGSTVNIVRASQSRALIVLSACPHRAPEIEDARSLLAEFDIPIFPGQITERRSFARAVASGRAVTEFETHGKAADEIRALWSYLKTELT